MSKNVLNKTLLSVAAASLLTSTASAFISPSLDIRHSTGNEQLYLDERGGAEELFRIRLDNTDPIFSVLEKVKLSVESKDIANLSFIKSVKLFKGSQATNNFMVSATITDQNITGTGAFSSISAILDVTAPNYTDPKKNFINTVDQGVTDYLIVLAFDEISNIDKGEVCVTLGDTEYELMKKTASGEVSEGTKTVSYDNIEGSLGNTVTNNKSDNTNVGNVYLNDDGTRISAHKWEACFVIDTTDPKIVKVGRVMPVAKMSSTNRVTNILSTTNSNYATVSNGTNYYSITKNSVTATGKTTPKDVIEYYEARNSDLSVVTNSNKNTIPAITDPESFIYFDKNFDIGSVFNEVNSTNVENTFDINYADFGIATDEINISDNIDDHNYSASFDVDVVITENLFSWSNVSTAQTFDVLNNNMHKTINSAFSMTDSAGNSLAITKLNYYFKGDTLSLASSTNDRNHTLVGFKVNPIVPIVGDVYLTYKGGFKDEANNPVTAPASKYKIFDDSFDPYIKEVHLSFENPREGEIHFSEVINPESMKTVINNVYGTSRDALLKKMGTVAVSPKKDPFVASYINEGNNGILNDKYTNISHALDADYKILSIEFDREDNDSEDMHTFNRQKSIYSFTLNKPVKISSSKDDRNISDLTITFDGNSSKGSVVQDMGENTVTSKTVGNIVTTEYARGEFITKDLLVKIVPNEWNLISIPTKKVTTAQHMFMTGTVQTVWGYDNNTWTKSPSIMHAGHGYWVKGLDITDYDSQDRNFSKTQTTSYKAKVIDSKTVIAKATPNTWTLLGTDKAMTWADAYGQVSDKCHTVSVYAYRPAQDKFDVVRTQVNNTTVTTYANDRAVDNNGTSKTYGTVNMVTDRNGTTQYIEYRTQTAGWNLDSFIPQYSGIWVKQENCEK